MHRSSIGSLLQRNFASTSSLSQIGFSCGMRSKSVTIKHNPFAAQNLAAKSGFAAISSPCFVALSNNQFLDQAAKNRKATPGNQRRFHFAAPTKYHQTQFRRPAKRQRSISLPFRHFAAWVAKCFAASQGNEHNPAKARGEEAKSAVYPHNPICRISPRWRCNYR